MSGAPAVIEVAVVTSPVLAVKVPVGTKLNATLIGIALAALPVKESVATAPQSAAMAIGDLIIFYSS